MARRKDTDSNSRFGGFQTVHLDFSDNERKTIVKWCDERNIDLGAILEENVTDGWKVSVSYSAGWGAYVCSVTPKDHPDFRGKVVYMFRHPTYSRISGFLQFFFGEMVPNRDARLDGERGADDW